MKKSLFIVLSFAIVILLTGCAKYDLDLTKVSESLTNLTGDNIDISLIYSEVTSKEEFQNLEYIYEFDYEEYNFNVDDLEEYSFGYNKENKDFYIVFKAKKEKDMTVKKSIESFIETLKLDEENEDILNKLEYYELREENGYIIAVASENPDDLIKAIKKSKSPIFSNMMDIPVESIEDVLGLKSEQVDEFLMATPMMIVRSDTYIIVKPSKGNKEQVKEKIDEYMANLENQWETYLPAQYELVKNRLEKELGDYLIYIVSTDNDLVYETIKNSKK